MAQNKVIFYPSFDHMLNSPDGDVGKHLARKGRLVTMLAKRQAGKRTGALRASIHMRHLRDPRGQYLWIGSELNYALVHHEGAKAHIIVPKHAKMLRFTRRGQVVFAHLVRHPGHRPNKYLSDQLKYVF